MFYIPSCDNVKIAVYDLNCVGKQTVFFVHGWPLSHEIFEYQCGMLLNCGYRVVSMDLRGFGNSDTPAFGYSYDQLSDDVFTVVKRLSLKNFTLVGFSMGGAVCVRYMARHKGYGVKKLALLAAAAPRFTTAPDFPYGMAPEAVDGLLSQAACDRPQFCADFAQKLFACPHSCASVNWFHNLALNASGIGTLQTGLALRDEELRPDLCKLCVPTSIFHGKLDQIVPFEMALLQNEAISNSQLFAFENSGHGVFYDELPLFNETFLQFLSQSC